jgi:hypothetical protein
MLYNTHMPNRSFDPRTNVFFVEEVDFDMQTQSLLWPIILE